MNSAGHLPALPFKVLIPGEIPFSHPFETKFCRLFGILDPVQSGFHLVFSPIKTILELYAHQNSIHVVHFTGNFAPICCARLSTALPRPMSTCSRWSIPLWNLLMDLLQLCSVDLQASSTKHTTIQGAESCTDGVQTGGKRNDTRSHTETKARVPKRVLYNHQTDTTVDPNTATANLFQYRLAF